MEINTFLEHKTEDTPNIVLVKNQYKALNEGFTDDLLEILSEKPIWNVCPGNSDGGTYCGMAEVFDTFYPNMLKHFHSFIVSKENQKFSSMVVMYSQAPIDANQGRWSDRSVAHGCTTERLAPPHSYQTFYQPSCFTLHMWYNINTDSQRRAAYAINRRQQKEATMKNTDVQKSSKQYKDTLFRALFGDSRRFLEL